jgi:hypothetical protein
MWSSGFASKVVKVAGRSSNEVAGVDDACSVEEVGCSAAGVVCGISVEVEGASPVSSTSSEGAVASTAAVVVGAGVEERAGAVVVGAGVWDADSSGAGVDVVVTSGGGLVDVVAACSTRVVADSSSWAGVVAGT